MGWVPSNRCRLRPGCKGAGSQACRACASALSYHSEVLSCFSMRFARSPAILPSVGVCWCTEAAGEHLQMAAVLPETCRPMALQGQQGCEWCKSPPSPSCACTRLQGSGRHGQQQYTSALFIEAIAQDEHDQQRRHKSVHLTARQERAGDGEGPVGVRCVRLAPRRPSPGLHQAAELI